MYSSNETERFRSKAMSAAACRFATGSSIRSWGMFISLMLIARIPSSDVSRFSPKTVDVYVIPSAGHPINIVFNSANTSPRPMAHFPVSDRWVFPECR